MPLRALGANVLYIPNCQPVLGLALVGTTRNSVTVPLASTLPMLLAPFLTSIDIKRAPKPQSNERIRTNMLLTKLTNTDITIEKNAKGRTLFFWFLRICNSAFLSGSVIGRTVVEAPDIPELF
ncbi:MAG TPA: hypothetical protein VKK79_03370 [Candidatus Lokiarchaeia archaeon]|nr:hypothetical protein [Candidatus Lokiarchaeia archaeon]